MRRDLQGATRLLAVSTGRDPMNASVALTTMAMEKHVTVTHVYVCGGVGCPRCRVVCVCVCVESKERIKLRAHREQQNKTK